MLLNSHSLEAAKFASKDEKRPVLSSLCVTPTHVAATDSYQLLEVRHLEQQEPTTPAGIKNDAHGGLIPASAALHAAKNIPTEDSLFALKNAFTSVDGEGKRMTLTTTNLTQEKSVEAVMIDGRFPEYEAIFPAGDPVARVAIDAKYLKNMAEYFAKHGDARRVVIEFHGDGKPLVFRGKTDVTIQDVRGVIMPLLLPDSEEGVAITKEAAKQIEREIQAAMPGSTVTVTVNGK